MKIAIGADHGGFPLKELLSAHLQGQGHDVLDQGTTSTEAVDYPRFARAVADSVAAGQAQRGIMIDGAGIGSCMVANKVSGVRAALAYDLSSARNGREHNDANVLTLGAGLIGVGLATQIVDVFLATECTESRHQRRVAMINDLKDAASDSPAAQVGDLSAVDLQRIIQRVEGLLGGGAAEAFHGDPAVAASPETARRFIELGARGLTVGPQQDQPVPQDMARYIDHTILKPDATVEMVTSIIDEAREHRFRSVCVNPCWVKFVADRLRGSGVLACSVVGFPLGASTPEIKAAETRQAIRDGAKEIDMVINVGRLKSGDDDEVLRDIRAVVEACRDGSALSKVIIETALLTNDEKKRVCRLARKARAHFVKTSTGFSSGGATAEDVALMASVVGDAGMEVKASGGIRSYADAKRMIDAGATRIGASASIAILEEAKTGD